MRRTVSLSEFMPYGAPELLAAHRSHLALALAAASAVAVLLFATALQLSPLFRITTLPKDPGFTIDPWPDTPPLPRIEPPPPSVAPRMHAEPDAGIVIPVPPTEAPPLAPPANGGQTGDRTFGSGPNINGPANDQSDSRPEPEPVLGVWNAVDEMPEAIREFKPEYPYLAQQANIEGLVVVHALIGKDGHVLRVELDKKFASPLLNETALEAAKHWVFKPAIANGHAVLFWVPIPFHFVLHE